jgi:uncharacterized membrane protein
VKEAADPMSASLPPTGFFRRTYIGYGEVMTAGSATALQDQFLLFSDCFSEENLLPSPQSHTAHDDAPLSSAKNPDPLAYGGELASRHGDVLIGRSVTIDRPRGELYSFWRDFNNLPRFMHNVHSVMVKDDRHSHWIIEASAGKTVEWDSEITRDDPGREIAWRSLEGANVRNSGQVEFLDSPDGRGTVVRVTLTYDPPAGAIGKLIARLFQKEPKVQARQDLRRFKQLMETGEVSTAEPPDAAPRA